MVEQVQRGGCVALILLRVKLHIMWIQLDFRHFNASSGRVRISQTPYQRNERTLVVLQLFVSSPDEASDVVVV